MGLSILGEGQACIDQPQNRDRTEQSKEITAMLVE